MDLAASLNKGIQVKLSNRARTFLRDVRLEVYLDDMVIATDWLPEDEAHSVDLFPDRPEDWGRQILLPGIGMDLVRNQGAVTPQSRHGIVDISRSNPAYLTMYMDSLRPEEVYIGDEDEVVLLMFTDDAPDSVTARWRLTAQDVNDVFEGTVNIAVRAVDWRDPIRNLLQGHDQDEGGEV